MSGNEGSRVQGANLHLNCLAAFFRRLAFRFLQLSPQNRASLRLNVSSFLPQHSHFHKFACILREMAATRAFLCVLLP